MTEKDNIERDAQEEIGAERVGPARHLESEEETYKHAPARVPARDSDREGKTPGYEVADVNVPGVAIATAGLIVLVVMGIFATGGILRVLDTINPQPTPVTLVQPANTPAPPRIWVAPDEIMQEYLSAEGMVLNEYGWVDQDAGVARIPISQAMQLLVESGLPARDQAPPAFGVMGVEQLESTGGMTPSQVRQEKEAP